MHFCPICEKAMIRNTSSDSVIYNCPACGQEIKGKALDARIGGSTTATENVDKYREIIDAAPFDRVAAVVLRDCPSCKLNYMYQIRLSDAGIVIHKCKNCGTEI